MINRQELSRINTIIKKIETDKFVSLNERLFLDYFSKNYPEIQNKLKKAQCRRRIKSSDKNELTDLMTNLALDGTLQEEHFNPSIETIEEWFLNAPKWLKRS
tara:strand:+ start:577 stop:882 length:306 start_codon:yes stop_codon:yes gene_type:complete